MGFLTLSDFREELAGHSGFRGFDNPKLDRYVNMGYREVLSSQDFENLKVCAELPLTQGQTKYAFREEILGVVSVKAVDSDAVLIYNDVENIMQQSSTEGKLQQWSRAGQMLFFWPPPSADQTVDFIYIKEFPDLALPEDVTAIPAAWDTAILLLAEHYAFLGVDENEKAQFYFTRAIAYMRSRLSDEDWSAGRRSMPVNVARSFEDLGRIPR